MNFSQWLSDTLTCIHDDEVTGNDSIPVHEFYISSVKMTVCQF
ncbi:hypothetical protein AmDm5_1258 [Acetobacter malorum]|nr:hypothetical protein AmDm5_1258 [Acetobacter malorum]